jgi:hypothetical protein
MHSQFNAFTVHEITNDSPTHTVPRHFAFNFSLKTKPKYDFKLHFRSMIALIR